VIARGRGGRRGRGGEVLSIPQSTYTRIGQFMGIHGMALRGDSILLLICQNQFLENILYPSLIDSMHRYHGTDFV